MIERVRYKFSMNSKNDLEGRREKEKKKTSIRTRSR